MGSSFSCCSSSTDPMSPVLKPASERTFKHNKPATPLPVIYVPNKPAGTSQRTTTRSPEHPNTNTAAPLSVSNPDNDEVPHSIEAVPAHLDLWSEVDSMSERMAVAGEPPMCSEIPSPAFDRGGQTDATGRRPKHILQGHHAVTTVVAVPLPVKGSASLVSIWPAQPRRASASDRPPTAVRCPSAENPLSVSQRRRNDCDALLYNSTTCSSFGAVTPRQLRQQYSQCPPRTSLLLFDDIIEAKGSASSSVRSSSSGPYRRGAICGTETCRQGDTATGSFRKRDSIVSDQRAPRLLQTSSHPIVEACDDDHDAILHHHFYSSYNFDGGSETGVVKSHRSRRSSSAAADCVSDNNKDESYFSGLECATDAGDSELRAAEMSYRRWVNSFAVQ